MYEFLRGSLSAKSPTRVVLDVAGVGFALEVSLQTSDRLPACGESVRLLVHQKIQDDRIRLFGFLGEEERSLFRLLLSVAGIGPAHALALLSARSPQAVWQLIRAGDAAALARTKGIGPKIAQRVCTELSDKAVRALEPVVPAGAPAADRVEPLLEDAVSALLVLGYSEAQARKAVEVACRRAGAPALVENVVREALRIT